MKEIIKHYSNGVITIIWKPAECIHSGICFKGLGEVFDPRKRPWITLENSTTEKIINQIKKCPSGALSYEDSAAGETNPEHSPLTPSF
jgi:uncharacterized Fe-S cluster protein YjdI